MDPSKIPGVNPRVNRTREGETSEQKRTERADRGPGRSFDQILGDELKNEVRVSRHAAARMQREGIRLDSAQNRRLGQAVDQVQKRGGETSLVLLDDVAMVVNVRRRTLITVVSGERRGGGVFTDIDSAVIAD